MDTASWDSTSVACFTCSSVVNQLANFVLHGGQGLPCRLLHQNPQLLQVGKGRKVVHAITLSRPSQTGINIIHSPCSTWPWLFIPMIPILLLLYQGLPVGIVPSLICSLWRVDLWRNARSRLLLQHWEEIYLACWCQEDSPFSVSDRRQRSRRLSIMEHWRKDNEWVLGVFYWPVTTMHASIWDSLVCWCAPQWM